MPKIDMGPFGREVAPAVERGAGPRVVPGAYDRSSGITAIGQGIDQASDIVARDAQITRQRDQAEATRIAYEQDKARRIEETTRAGRDQIAFKSASGEHVQSLLADDTTPNDQKVQKFKDWSGSQRDALEPTYKMPDVHGVQQIHFDEVTALGVHSLNDGIMKNNISAARANLASSIELLGRQARTVPLDQLQPLIDKADGMVISTGAATDSHPSDIQKITQQNAETFTLAKASSSLLEDPVTFLDDLKGGKYSNLTPEATTSLQGRAQAEIAQRANRADIDAQRRDMKAYRALNDARQTIRDGYLLTPAAAATLADLTHGTEFQDGAQHELAMQADRAAFSSKPIEKQAQELKNLDARAHDPAIGIATDDKFQLQWKEQQHAGLLRAIDTRGALSVYASTHSIDLPNIDPSTPEGIASGLAARNAISDEASIWSGRPVGPLMPEEVKAVGAGLDQGTATQRLRMLDGLGKSIADPVKFRATMGELAKGQANLATAGMHIQNANSRAAELIVRGQVILKPPAAGGIKAPPMPDDAKLASDFNEATGDMFLGNTDDRQRLYQASRAVYAAMTEDQGAPSTEPDLDRWKAAIDTAAGGIVELDLPWTTKTGHVIKPPRMSADDFMTSLRSVTADQVAAMGGAAAYTSEQVAEAIRDGGIKNYDNGKQSGYTVRDGSHLIMKADLSGPFVWDPSDVIPSDAHAVWHGPQFQ